MNKMIKWLGNYWLTGIALIMFAISICINFTKIEDSNSGLIFGFVGILATFIVVGNYAQVMTIRSEFDEKIKESETKYNDAINKLNSSIVELQSSQIETNTKLTESKGIFYYNLGLALYSDEKYPSALNAYFNALEFFINSNSTSYFDINSLEIEELQIFDKISIEDYNSINGDDTINKLKRISNNTIFHKEICNIENFFKKKTK